MDESSVGRLLIAGEGGFDLGPYPAIGSWLDRVVMGFSVLGFSVPVFVVGYLLIYVFSIWLNWLPVQG